MADTDALYVVWGGGNDLRDILGGADPVTTRDAALGNLQLTISALISMGAREFLVLNAPDLGLIPAVTATGAMASASASFVSADFNAELAMMLENLRSTSPATIHEVDVFGLLNQVVANPMASGIINPLDACINVGDPDPLTSVCDDPGGYLFWDGIHPTTYGHSLIASEALAVLEAASVAVGPMAPVIYLLGLGLLMRARKRT